jgi:hypothetical protein
MIIIHEHDEHGWITAIIDGRWCQAKVYDEPSTFGINNGRVSKLVISKSSNRDNRKPFFEQMDFNYSRGLDFSNMKTDEVNSIVEQLENLPKIFDNKAGK